MKGTGAKRNVFPGSCVSTGAKLPVAPVESAPMMCSNLNVRQATSQQVFKVTTFCRDTCFQSFSPLINRILHHAVLKFSTSQADAATRLIRIADWYSIHALLL